jgi:FkbM family methyltransferase
MSASPDSMIQAQPRSVGVRGKSLLIADDKPTFWDRVEAGTWEESTFAVLDRYVDADTTLLDLGAWVGPVSLYGAARGARVVAVEADPAALVQLRANLDANPDLAARITIVDRAIAPDAQPVRMGARRKPGDSMSSALLAGADSHWDAAAVTPEALAATLGAPARLFVKLDIEGGEYALLPAMGALLDAPATALLLSLHPKILRESGVADVDAVTNAALSGFATWDSFGVADGAIVRRDLLDALRQGGVAGDWLLTRNWPQAGAG